MLIDFKSKRTTIDEKHIQFFIDGLNAIIADTLYRIQFKYPLLDGSDSGTAMLKAVVNTTAVKLIERLLGELHAGKGIKDSNPEDYRNYMDQVNGFTDWYENAGPNDEYAVTFINPEGGVGDRVIQYIFGLTSSKEVILSNIYSERGNLVSVIMNMYAEDNITLKFGI